MLEENNLKKKLFETVVAGDYCIGCGMCAAFDDQLDMSFDAYGKYVVKASCDMSSDIEGRAAYQVCPFAEGNSNEDEIGKILYGSDANYNSQVGYYRGTYAGWAVTEAYRDRGSSGGLITWLLVNLLDQGIADHIVHVGQEGSDHSGEPMYGFSISSTSDEVRSKSKSRYYPVEMSQVMRHILEVPGRYVLVGLPCFVKAVRLAARLNPVLAERIVICVGVVCGHLKSKGFAELLGWQAGVHPNQLKSVDFRVKLPDSPASQYGVEVKGVKPGGEALSVTKPMSTMFGNNWGYGFFKYKACDFCDDVLAETADVSFGDAWLPQYASDSRGTNVVVRSELIQRILDVAVQQQQIHLDHLDPKAIAASQDAGLRHRREGLAYRLSKQDEAGYWRPKKRVEANASSLSKRRRDIQDLRELLAEKSHTELVNAKNQNDLTLFISSMRKITAKYDSLYRPSLIRRFLSKVRRSVT